MPLNSSTQDIIAKRRERVAELRLQGYTERAIVGQLAHEGFLNHDTNQPFSLGTIHADLKALKTEWQQQAQENIALQISQLLAESREVRRVAWEKGNLAIVQRGIGQELHILSLSTSANVGTQPVRAEIVPPSPAFSAGRIAQEIEDGDGQLALENISELVQVAVAAAEPEERTALVNETEKVATALLTLYEHLRSATQKTSTTFNNNKENANER